jgi:hypothetical protein
MEIPIVGVLYLQAEMNLQRLRYAMTISTGVALTVL